MIWHQALLAFAQRYKTDLEDLQRKRFKNLLKVHSHHLITPEIRRELFSGVYSNTMNGGDDDDTITVISKKSVKSTMSSTKMLGQRATVAKNSMEMDV